MEALDGATSLLNETIADSTPTTAGDGAAYEPYTFAFTATSSSTTIRFTDLSTGDLSGADLVLDRVALREVATRISAPW